MNTPQMLAALAALVLAVAALIRTLGGAFESRFSELRKELTSLREELNTERRLRIAAQQRAIEAESRALAAETQVLALIEVNTKMRTELDLMRNALVGSEADRNAALIELARRSQNDERENAAGSIEVTAPHKSQKP